MGLAKLTHQRQRAKSYGFQRRPKSQPSLSAAPIDEANDPKIPPGTADFREHGTVSGHGAAAERFYDAVKKTLDVVKVGRSDRDGWAMVTGLT